MAHNGTSGTAVARVTVIGESVIDVVKSGKSLARHVGGSAANVAVALARLGVDASLATGIGPDQDGRRIVAHLEANGVRLLGDPRLLDRTATAVATLGPDGSASYEFDIEWNIETTPIRGGDVIHVCSIGAVLEPGAGRVREVIERLGSEALVTYDINLRTAITGSGPDIVRRVEQIASQADLVKASDEDLRELYPARPVDESAIALKALGPAAVVVTRGADGASVWAATGRVDVASPGTHVVDTIGAGDTFMAALISALGMRGAVGPDGRRVLDASQASAWRQDLTFAGRAAAITVSRAGANPPHREELGSRVD